ncbi:CoA transferase [Sinomonas atrocyanea]|uniref:CoA transferase n=1 Tax=Sinomonas atrocyanea TaxID=37927 RepID=UPI002785A0FE|nr:CoA transferase [Sinomonas atrocyanea]MDQ0258958.1 crotonobetainyl-CoA:carnitine CoA-transferase CaiB-like acyl-CoA transferase [Sinomonas atrocyanea]MDR6621935.1 crotonobetainyl-CoA:carnitine CoA-transferase CaiB-like acyl-CoA transferase [Sinomonas atrocyanea]
MSVHDGAASPGAGASPDAGLLGLRHFLAPALDGVSGGVPEPAGWWSGPRTWWAGALDVEGLALGSLGALIAALASLAEARGEAAGGSRLATSSALAAASFDSIRRLRVDGKAPDIWAPMSGFRRARDGWVRLHANYPHHAQALLAGLGIAGPERLDAAVLERDALDVEATVRAAGGVAAAVRTPAEWTASEAGAAAAGELWIRWSIAEAPAVPVAHDAAPGLPLDGVRVLDLTRVIAGPSASRLLGALGADVLRVDPPHHPELLDAHLDTGFAKRSAVADLRVVEQLGQVRALARAADAVLLGYRQASLARFGLDVESLRADCPQLAVVALDAWGWSGPWVDARGFDSIVQAACGISDLYGTPAGTSEGAPQDGAWRPGALPVQALDHATGMGMAAAAVALLAARTRGIAGSARLSLAATAHELLRAGPPPASAPADLTVGVRRAASSYGELDYVGPPLAVDGRPLEYPHPPVRYGTSPLEWAR